MDRCYIHEQGYKSSTKATASEFLTDTVNRCLTDDCKDCTGSYSNDMLRHRLVCLCLCHRKCKKNASLNQEEAKMNKEAIIHDVHRKSVEEESIDNNFDKNRNGVVV
jgi:hypothetical protein